MRGGDGTTALTVGLVLVFGGGLLLGYAVGSRDARTEAGRREVAAICAARCAPAAAVIGKGGECGCALGAKP